MKEEIITLKGIPIHIYDKVPKNKPFLVPKETKICPFCGEETMPKTTAKREETITIPMHLAKLLAAEPEDIKEGDYENVQAVAKSLLRLLMEVK